MRKILLFLIIFSFLFGIEYTKKEKQFLKNNPIIYISAMKYWPIDKDGESLHTNYLKLINKYGRLNLQPVYYQYWSDGFNDAKDGVTYGIMALSYSKQREKWFYYTKPYNYHPYYLLVNKNSKIYSLNDLKNKNVFIAKNSILRETLKNKDFNIIYTKNAYQKLANNQIDAILLFYVPKTKYLKNFRIIKTFIDKNGEEYIGISKKYPELYSIINKVIDIIPYSEIEKIRKIPYKKRLDTTIILTPQLTLKELMTKEDILLEISLFIGLLVILYMFYNKTFLDLNIKKFLISIFLFESFILGFIVYEIIIFNYYSNKILEIKSKSFNALYLVDKIENRVINLNIVFNRKYDKHKGNLSKLFVGDIKADNLKIQNKALKNYLNINNFTPTELEKLAYIKNLFDEVLKLQQKVLNKQIPFSIYKQKFISLIDEFENTKEMIKKENQKEISLINQKLKYQFMLLIISIILFIIESIFIFVMIKKKIYDPIKYLTNVIKQRKSGYIVNKNIQYKDEMGDLIEEFFSLQEQLDEKIVELNYHKQTLEQQVQNEVEKRVYQEKILLKQSKLALMGEMIDSIAHQWKQPLNRIALSVEILKIENYKVTPEELQECVDIVSLQTTHLFETLNEFRSFFKENKTKEKVCMKEVVQKALMLLNDDLMKNHIVVDTKIDDFCIEGRINEFLHLIITLLTNAKDIFNERDIKNRKITIQTRKENNFYYLEVIDNAGGIPEEIKDKIFELNYTTREDGTGVGLYLAKQIAIKHLGVLDVKNTENGANFYFKINIDN